LHNNSIEISENLLRANFCIVHPNELKKWILVVSNPDLSNPIHRIENIKKI
jgi:hypothetical protein